MHKNRGEPVKEILSIEAALYHAAHDFTGGVPAVAGALGQSPRTLQNKLNIGSAEPSPTLKDFRNILNLTRDDRIVQAVLHPVGYVGIRVGDFSLVSDMELLDSVNKIVARIGETTQDLMTSLSDGKIDSRECGEIEGDVNRAVQALHEFLARVQTMRDDKGEAKK